MTRKYRFQSRCEGFCIAALVLGACSAHADPSILFDTTSIDVGAVAHGSAYQQELPIFNAGDAPLVVERIVSTCECLMFESDVLPFEIAPAGEYRLPIAYLPPASFGKFKHRIIIGSNDPTNPITGVVITGYNGLPVIFEPESLRWTAARGTTLAQTLRLRPAYPDLALKFIGGEVLGTAIAVSLVPYSEDGVEGAELRFTLPDTLDPAEYKTEVSVLLTLDGKDEVLQIPFLGTVLTDQDVSPRVIRSPSTPRKPGDFLGQVVIQPNREGERIEIADLRVSGLIRAELAPYDTEPERRVNVFANHVEPGPIQEATVQLTTTSEDEPLLTIPVVFRPAPPIMAEPDGFRVELEPGQALTREIVFTSVYHQQSAITEARIEVLSSIQAEAGATDIAGATATKADTGTPPDGTVAEEEIPMERPAELPDALVSVARIEQEVLGATPEVAVDQPGEDPVVADEPVVDQPAVVALTLTAGVEAKEQRERVIVTTNIEGFETIEIPITIRTVLPDVAVETVESETATPVATESEAPTTPE